jgi:Glycosyl transferases group 1
MPGVEDFGMVPVEAQACGRPVVVLAEGGAVESVMDGVTGLLVRAPSVEAFTAALRDVSGRDFDTAAIRRHAESFSKARFQEQFLRVIDESPVRPPNPADRDSESRGSDDDPREISDQRSSDPEDRSNAAKYRQRPRNSAARENKK